MQETHSKIFFSNHTFSELADNIKPILIADNFSTPENIGHLIRLAANIGASKVIITGSDNLRKSKIRKTAGTAIDHIPLVYSGYKDLENHIPNDYTLTALETADGAKNIFSTKLPDKMALILGNEKYGVRKDLLDICKLKIFIPMPGPVKSMNVSHAAAVCLFCWLNRHQ